MLIYVLVVSVICLLPFFLRNLTKRKVIYCFAIGLMLTIIMGLRSYKLGLNDVELSYVPMFKNVASMTFFDVIRYYTSDPLFYISAKLCTYLFSNAHIWLFLISLFWIGSISYLIYRESSMPSLSFILFLTLNYYGHSFTILRQVVALSFIIWAFLSYKDHNKIRSYLLFILACGFHITAISFVAFYVFGSAKVGIKQFIGAIVVFLLASLSGNWIIKKFFSIFTIERFVRYEITNTITSFNYTLLLIAVVVFIVGCICNNRSSKPKIIFDKNREYFNLSILNIMALCFIKVWDLMFRVAMFYGIFSILYLPNALYSVKNQDEKILYIFIIYCICVTYFLLFAVNSSGISPYLSFLVD